MNVSADLTTIHKTLHDNQQWIQDDTVHCNSQHTKQSQMFSFAHKSSTHNSPPSSEDGDRAHEAGSRPSVHICSVSNTWWSVPEPSCQPDTLSDTAQVLADVQSYPTYTLAHGTFHTKWQHLIPLKTTVSGRFPLSTLGSVSDAIWTKHNVVHFQLL